MVIAIVFFFLRKVPISARLSAFQLIVTFAFALVNSVLNLRVPWNAGKLSSGVTSSGLSSSAQLHIVS
jgi:hypothetical protein